VSTIEGNLPLRHGLGRAAAGSLVTGAAVVLASALGLFESAARYSASQSIPVSRGADAANLIVVVVLLVSMWLARRGSLVALLLWPGALFYLAYAYIPYLVGAPFTPLVFGYFVVFLASVYGLTALLFALDGDSLRQRFAAAHARTVGGILTAIGVLAYAGLVVTAIGTFDGGATEAAWRGHWVADWVVGTPALLLGGIMLWARRPFGYSVAPAMLLVSALGGVVFAAAAALDNFSGGLRTDWTVVVVHLVISAVSLAVLVWHLGALSPEKFASGPRREPGRRSGPATSR
jgi:hypothetical protein